MADGNQRPADPIVNNEGYQGDDVLTRIGEWDKHLDAHWDGWYDQARECYDFMAGRQWTRDEVDIMETLGRIPIVFNRIGPTIDAVSGAEIGNRQQVQYFPRQVGDTAIDDILTQGAEWIMDECQGNEEDSDAFKDTLICGIGCTETRPTVQKTTSIIKERVDPMEMAWDASARKANFADARYLRRKRPVSKEHFRQMFPGFQPEADNGLGSRQPVIVDPRIRYTGANQQDTISKDEVLIREYQWFDEQPRFLVGDIAADLIRAKFPKVPTQDGLVKLTPEQHDELQTVLPGTKSTQVKERVYFRAFVSAAQVMQVDRIEAGDFLYKAITGKRDRNKNWWYGLVRPMIDPQRWANKLYSQIMHMFRTNAQGGVIMEEDAVPDIKQFEDSWADPSRTTVVKKGALSNPQGAKIQPKPQTQYPQGMDELMQYAVAAIRDTTGVNQEMLGAADAQAQKAGILEAQRTRQAFGILAAFFDAKRRYHQEQGKLLLKLMSLYLPPGRLVRITKDSKPQYVPLALSRDAEEYDVIVDEAPGGPNQKMQVFQILLQLLPLLQNAGLSATTWAEFARYSPLPANVAEKVAQDLLQKEQAQQQQAPIQQKLQMAGAQAKIADIAASAKHHDAQAELAAAKAAQTHMETAKGVDPEPIEQPAPINEKDLAAINLDRAKTGKLLAETVSELTEPKDER